jgi:hypothetical protein
MPERRQTIRQKSFLRGCVYSFGRTNSASCIIRNISCDGARVVFAAAVNIPDVIEFAIPEKMRTVRARVTWRHGNELGLAFCDASLAPSARAQINQLGPRIAQLETEITALRRLYEQT